MKTEDELDVDIANLFDEVTITKVETVNGKPRVTDEQTIAQMEREEGARRMEEACGIFLTAERKFQKLSAHPDIVTDPKLNIAWWDALDDVYRKERTVWRNGQDSICEGDLSHFCFGRRYVHCEPIKRSGR